VALLPALLALGVDGRTLSDTAERSTGGQIRGLEVILDNPIFWLCSFAMFFYGPLEASMAAWTTTYLMERGVAEGTATTCLSAFWLAFLSTRLLTAFALPAGQERLLVLMLALACVGVLLGMVVSRTGSQAMIFVVAAGLVFGPLFPTLMAIMQGSIPDGARGRAVGFYFAIGGIGWTAIPMLIGAYARTRGIQRGFRIAVMTAGCLAAVALFLFSLEK
jgi:fucose permease